MIFDEKTWKIQLFQLNISLNSEIFQIEVQNHADLRPIFLHREFQNQPIRFKIVLKWIYVLCYHQKIVETISEHPQITLLELLIWKPF